MANLNELRSSIVDNFFTSPGRWIFAEDLGYGMIVEDQQETLLVKFDDVVMEITEDFYEVDIPDFTKVEGVWEL